jgi:hypothetical protein
MAGLGVFPLYYQRRWSAMQRLLDGMPERWRDADLAWWPACATDMWSAPESTRSVEQKKTKCSK